MWLFIVVSILMSKIITQTCWILWRLFVNCVRPLKSRIILFCWLILHFHSFDEIIGQYFTLCDFNSNKTQTPGRGKDKNPTKNQGDGAWRLGITFVWIWWYQNEKYMDWYVERIVIFCIVSKIGLQPIKMALDIVEAREDLFR